MKTIWNGLRTVLLLLLVARAGCAQSSDSLRQLEAEDDFIDELLVALHRPKVALVNHLLLQQTPTFD